MTTNLEELVTSSLTLVKYELPNFRFLVEREHKI